ncbi:hypothetical protein BDV18DRAFT_40476 [Aspergillus unguis]
MRFLPLVLFGSLAAARCGTREPSERIHSRHRYYQEKEDREAARVAARDAFDVTIDTYVHVVTNNETQGVNRSSLPAQIHEQIDVLNENYNKAGFTFNLVNVSYTHNNAWRAITDGSETEYEVKSQLRQGDYKALNLYLGTIGGGVLGYATFPDEVTSREFAVDGVVCDPRSLPGGKAPYDLGITAVHETGHWLNLFHTFQSESMDPLGGCYGAGDHIHDTPAEGYPNYGCPKHRDTCTGAVESNNTLSVPGLDPVHNIMDYSDDACLTQLTQGQIVRIQNSWKELREGFTPKTHARRGNFERLAKPGLTW